MLPARRDHHDTALDAALARLAPGQLPDLPDTPDHHVTAMRRLPAVAAQFAPFPDGLDSRLKQALQTRGIQELYSHQASAVDHALAGLFHRVRRAQVGRQVTREAGQHRGKLSAFVQALSYPIEAEGGHA